MSNASKIKNKLVKWTNLTEGDKQILPNPLKMDAVDQAFDISTMSPLNTTTTAITPSDIDPPIRSCNYFVISKNTTVVFDFSNQYGGIPQNLVFNLIGWAILMLLFAFLRRAAGNYGRWALVRKDSDTDAKWTQLFFAPDDVSVETEEHVQVTDIRDGQSTGQEQAIVDISNVDYPAEEAAEDRRIGAWILSIFTLTDDQYLRKCGVDAVQYMKFQRHLIFFMFIITVVCVGIILPINFQGNCYNSNIAELKYII